MYSGYGGNPSRSLSTMSLSTRSVRSLTSKSIARSQSFTGVNSQDKPFRNLSVFSTPGLNRKPSRTSKMFSISTKSNPPSKVPQPERMIQVYEALKKGLQSYLQVHQMDMDNLSRRMKESKRNSRLGFLYELDKQVKVTERYIRRLEFHLSRIEELYEAYCLQRRLRDGANKLVKAYTASSDSKEARESLAEANKGYKEYSENMCVLENAFENQLGEFHIKMKGLAGFARLCAGDQYEIFMKYGRQRWKLRGRIEINAKQVWDSEEMIFLPLINEFLSVKVTELKSLANHVVVGSVSCETKDLLAALPQMVAVDINDLGTIKLSLEVTWNPFDKDDQGSVASTVNKVPTVNKRFSSIFNQSPPDTPSLREQAFHNLLHHHEKLENGTAWSHSSESSDDSSSPQLSVGGLCSTTNQKPHISVCLSDSSSSTPNSTHIRVTSEAASSPKHHTDNREKEKGAVVLLRKAENEDSGKQLSTAALDIVVTNTHDLHCLPHTLSHITESSTDGVVLMTKTVGESEEVVSLSSGLSINYVEREMQIAAATATDLSPCRLSTSKEKPLTASVTNPHQNEEKKDTPNSVLIFSTSSPSSTEGVALTDMQPQLECNTLPDNGDVTCVAWRVSVEDIPDTGEDGCEGLVDNRLEEALSAVVTSLDDYRGQFPELQLLEQELRLLQVTLKGGKHSCSTDIGSLTVETALGSFDFLNTADWDEEEEENGDKRRKGRSMQDRGSDTSSSPINPFTTGCPSLDSALVIHLKNSSTQLLRLGTFGPLLCGEIYALDRLLREARVLKIIQHITENNPRCLQRPDEVIPQLSLCQGAVSLWQQCVGEGSVYCICTESFLGTLSTVYSGILPENSSNMADTVFLCLVERILHQRLTGHGRNRDTVTVTLFQLWTYLEANGISDIETHISELAEEVWLVQSLASSDQSVVVHALRHPPECSLRTEGLHAVAKLLKDPRSKVSALARSVLRGLAAQKTQRERALVSCLELLEHESVNTRVCACKALACLKANESIDQLVYLCRTDKEEVREAAKQALLVLGEEGKMAYRHVEISQDSIPRFFTTGSMASTAF